MSPISTNPLPECILIQECRWLPDRKGNRGRSWNSVLHLLIALVRTFVCENDQNVCTTLMPNVILITLTLRLRNWSRHGSWGMSRSVRRCSGSHRPAGAALTKRSVRFAGGGARGDRSDAHTWKRINDLFFIQKRFDLPDGSEGRAGVRPGIKEVGSEGGGEGLLAAWKYYELGWEYRKACHFIIWYLQFLLTWGLGDADFWRPTGGCILLSITWNSW